MLGFRRSCERTQRGRLSWCPTLSRRREKCNPCQKSFTFFVLIWQETALNISNPPQVFCETQTAQQRLPWLHRSKEKEPLVMVGKSRRMDLVGKAPPLTSRQSTMKCMKETGKAPLLSGSPSMWPSCGGRGGQTRRYVGGGWRRADGGETGRRRWWNYVWRI